MNRTFLTVVLALALSAGYALTAFSQVKPDVMVKQRQAAMTLLGKYFGPLGGMAQGAVPYNADAVARNAGYLEVLSKMPWDGFQPITAKENSNALPAIYADTAKFKKAADEMQAAVGKLVSSSKGGEAPAKAAIGAVGKACGACHDNFRQKH